MGTQLFNLLMAFGPVTFLVLMVLAGLVAGTWMDREHARHLRTRRDEMAHVMVCASRDYPLRKPGEDAVLLVTGCAAVGNNAFLSTIARFKMLFGGEVRSFDGMVTRARQEAVMRMIEAAAAAGFDAVCNVRVISADVGGQTMKLLNRQNTPLLNVAVLATGTAYRRDPSAFPPPMPPQLLEIPM